MLCLTSKRNNLHLKQVNPGWNTQAEIDTGSTIEYVMKSHQVKKTIVNCTYVLLKAIVNCTDVRLKVLKILTSHK